jgi:hypothetical protein
MLKRTSMILTMVNTAILTSGFLPVYKIPDVIRRCKQYPEQTTDHFGKNEDRPEQVEYYGVRFNLGIKLNF